MEFIALITVLLLRENGVLVPKAVYWILGLWIFLAVAGGIGKAMDESKGERDI